jgi:hypothetical protein
VSQTLGTATVASASTVAVSATVTHTLGTATLASDATTVNARSAVVNQTLGTATLTSAATVAIVGATSQTLGAATLTSAATVAITSTVSQTLGTATLAATVVAQVALQYMRPDGDVSLGGWTDQDDGTTNIYAAIDETVADDDDYIQSPAGPSNATYRGALSTGQIQEVMTSHTLSYRFKASDTDSTVDLTVRLMEGATVIASWAEEGISDSWVTQARELTEEQAGTITDPHDLEFELIANTPT